MLALVLTLLVALFILGPDLIARWILGFVVQRRNLVQSRGEEVFRAIAWATVPLGLAIFWFISQHVFYKWGSWTDIEVVVSGLYSVAYFDAHRQEVFHSLVPVFGIALSLLGRLYLIVFAGALVLNVGIQKFRWLRHKLKPKWAKQLLATIILPRVAEWHILLSDMLLPIEDVILAVDVLTKSGTLYQGTVQDILLAADGSLQTVTLADPRRFLRDDFRKAKNADNKAKADQYWRIIPGKLFVLIASDIASMNVRYPPRNVDAATLNRLEFTPQDLDSVRELLSKLFSPESKG